MSLGTVAPWLAVTGFQVILLSTTSTCEAGAALSAAALTASVGVGVAEAIDWLVKMLAASSGTQIAAARTG
jgi:hypothetical protein